MTGVFIGREKSGQRGKHRADHVTKEVEIEVHGQGTFGATRS